MWYTVVWFCIVICSGEEQYNVTITDPLPAAAAAVESSTRIIGGSQTTIETYPYTVQVQANSRLQCGGSLLTLRHVLSAAHCFVNPDTGQILNTRMFSIRAGATRLASGGTVVSVSTLILHGSYNRWNYDNDIAVLVLSKSLRRSARISTISIPTQGAVVPTNASVIHVGWGRTNADVDQPSQVLRHVTVYIVNHTVCTQLYRDAAIATNQPIEVTQNMICAGVLNQGGRDACLGDSGGPLIYNGVQVGITSWGLGCGHPMYPGVNTRVSMYTTWINTTITRFNSGPRLESINHLILGSLITYFLIFFK